MVDIDSNFGKLVLVPTPIDESSPLENVAKNLLTDAFNNSPERSIFVVEDLKPARKRWINFGLPREAICHFEQLNEHNQKEFERENYFIRELKAGKNIFLMSDGGLPAFCDPGQKLVRRAHKENIQVTSTPFCNSVILALALSGFSHDNFFFSGFLPREDVARKKMLENIGNNKVTTIIMDTPYRLHRLLEEISVIFALKSKRKIFLALDLNSEKEKLILNESAREILEILGSDIKREFVLILE